MKNNFLKPYLKGLIKDHFGYIFFNIGLISLIIIFTYLNLPRLTQNTNKIKSLQKEVTVLQNKLNALNSINANPEDLKIYLNFLNKLIPNIEDYFSIIYTLEQISEQTNFNIISYTVNLKQSTNNKLKLNIEGSGHRDAFIKFLSTYNFGGGRLMTSDRIELNPDLQGALKIDVYFYNQKTDIKDTSQFDSSLVSLQEVANLYNKVNVSIKEETQENTYVYPRKTNPF
jgi:hypothetical protein